MNPNVNAVQEALAWAAENSFPRNEVTRNLRSAAYFLHDGQNVRNIHRTIDSLCDVIAGLIVTRGCRRVLEIGTLFGYSTLHIAEALTHTGGTVDTVDLALPERTWGDGSIVRDIHKAAANHAALGGFSEIIRFHHGDSTEVLPRMVLSGDIFDLVFIDGAHDRYTVTLDFMNAANLLAPDGVIVFDDIGRAMAASSPDYHGGANSILPALWSSHRFDFVPVSANTLVAFSHCHHQSQRR